MSFVNRNYTKITEKVGLLMLDKPLLGAEYNRKLSLKR